MDRIRVCFIEIFHKGSHKMNGEESSFQTISVKNAEQSKELMEKFFSVAKPESVFAQPVSIGDRTIINTNEVSISMGFGHGSGGGKNLPEQSGEAPSPSEGNGSGGGGGGFTLARPVSTIVVSPEGVTVQPIFDITKIALAAITALGSMILLRMRMAKRAK